MILLPVKKAFDVMNIDYTPFLNTITAITHLKNIDLDQCSKSSFM